MRYEISEVIKKDQVMELVLVIAVNLKIYWGDILLWKDKLSLPIIPMR